MSVPPVVSSAVTVNVSEVPAGVTVGIPVSGKESAEPGAVSRMVSANASDASPLTPLRFWFMSLPYQSWMSGPTVRV